MTIASDIAVSRERGKRWTDTAALNEKIARDYREGYRPKVIAARYGIPPQRVWRVARAYAGG